MKKVKVLAMLLLLLSLVAFFLTFVLFTTRENEKEKRLIAEEQNAVLLSKNEEMVTQVNQLTEAEKDLNRRLAIIVKEKNEMQSQFDTINDEKKRAIDSLSSVQMDLDKSRQEYIDYKIKTADIVSEFKEQNEKLLLKIEQLEEQMKKNQTSFSNQVSSAALQSDGLNTFGISSQNQQVNLPKVVVTPTDAKSGKIVVVNRKYNFFITNLGREDNIKVNDKVGVFRNNELIATAIVEKVYDNLCASAIKQEKQGYSIQEGDMVKIQSL